MDINVKLLNSNDPDRGNFSIRLTNVDETIGDIKKKIALRLNLPNSSTIRLLFSGQFLFNDQQRVGDLELGPATFLNALVADVSPKIDGVENDQNEKSIGSEEKPQENQEPRQWRSRFFVYCKNNCVDLKPGKLRVRCSICKSSAVLVTKEPNSWNDVLTRNSIPCRCLENGCSPSDSQLPSIEFYFKCARCSQENGVVPLPQLKSMRRDGSSRPCSICSSDDDGGVMVIFSCEESHSTCLDCFVAYATEKLERRNFVMHPIFGYTLPCPEPRCRDGFISDAHHFRLLGDEELYQKYHRLAAEIYLLGEGGLYCPKVDCGEAFIADSSSDQRNRSGDRSESRKLILCPKCGWAFCFYCRANASECRCADLGNARDNAHSVAASIARIAGPDTPTTNEARSYATIHWTTKSCPNCRAPTEKNEGCNHMTCVQCSFDWCWDCEKRWTEDCQWNHWFD